MKEIISRINKLKRIRKFYPWDEAYIVEEEIMNIAEDIDENITDPDEGLLLLADLIPAVNKVNNNVDSSMGGMAPVFERISDLYIKYGKNFKDRKKLISITMKLINNDGFGICDGVLNRCGDMFSYDELKEIADRYIKKYEKEKNEHRKFTISINIQSFAEATNDVDLLLNYYEKYDNKNKDSGFIRLAKMCNRSGDYERALEFISRIQNKEFHYDESTLIKIESYLGLGDTESAEKEALQYFVKEISVERLDYLLEIAGEDKREFYKDYAVKHIISNHKLDYGEESFLINIGEYETAAEEILRYKEYLDGHSYHILLYWLKPLKREGYLVQCSLIYRALIDNILQKARSKNYRYAVSYMRQLDRLAEKIEDWKGVEDHEAYFEQFKEEHRLKKSLWAKYGDG
ncbi:MAG: hypothetical protein SVK54_01195 [candidate division WOR-3 bacterium]|nr:hypothetical protein [candidate division WOR-3 bacterium]